MAKNKSAPHKKPPGALVHEKDQGSVTQIPLPTGVEASTLVGMAASFSGPLPPPSLLKGYEECGEGFADRILAMAEKQLEHRHKIESQVIASDIWRANRGLFLGASLCLLAVVGGCIVAAVAHTYAGATIAVGPIGVIGSIFMWNQSQRRQERDQKTAQMVQPGRK